MYLYPFLAILRPLTYMHLYFGSYMVKPKSWMLNLLPNQSSAIIKDLRLLFCVRHFLTERRLQCIRKFALAIMLSSPMTLICQFEILPFAIVLQFFTVGAMFNIARIAISCKKNSLQRLGCNWKLIFTNSSRLLTLTQSSKDLR